MTPDFEAAIPRHGALACRELRAALSSYKVPGHVIVLAPQGVPRAASAKVRKAELARLIAARLGATGAGYPPAAAVTAGSMEERPT